jgi:hypothetical protein
MLGICSCSSEKKMMKSLEYFTGFKFIFYFCPPEIESGKIFVLLNKQWRGSSAG